MFRYVLLKLQAKIMIKRVIAAIKAFLVELFYVTCYAVILLIIVGFIALALFKTFG